MGNWYEILRFNPQLLDSVHDDFLTRLSQSSSGRNGAYTSEQIFRCLIVLFIEQWSFRKTVVHIDTNYMLQDFVGLGFLPMMDYTFLSKAFSALSETTWERINQTLSQYAVQEEKISGEKLRMDSTVYETNIHWPTDSSLLWDSFRTLSRILRSLRDDMRSVGLTHRFHTKKIKKLSNFISRNGGSKNKRKQQQVKAAYRILIDRVQWIHAVGERVLQKLKYRLVVGELAGLEHYLPLVEKVVAQARMRVLEGIKLPADQKLYSLFEEHTELLKRGKAGKDIEFGHKILVAQSEDKFITHYQVLEKRREDVELLETALESHENLFGELPSVLAADKGFYKDRDQLEQLGDKIATVSIGKKGNRTAAEKERESTKDFKDGQRFRAGSEGSISVLKRVFKLKKCMFKGFKNFAASVGCAVFCHNLVLLTRM